MRLAYDQDPLGLMLQRLERWFRVVNEDCGLVGEKTPGFRQGTTVRNELRSSSSDSNGREISQIRHGCRPSKTSDICAVRFRGTSSSKSDELMGDGLGTWVQH